jgi:hypothetical protein
VGLGFCSGILGVLLSSGFGGVFLFFFLFSFCFGVLSVYFMYAWGRLTLLNAISILPIKNKFKYEQLI